MALQVLGSANSTIMDVDASKNTQVVLGVAGANGPIENLGGYFMASGQGGAGANVAASLAANTTLMGMRNAPGSAVNIYVDKIRINISVATVGTSALVPGVLGVQRFKGATFSGGTLIIPAKRNPYFGTGSSIVDIRDNTSALTTTGATFGDVIASTVIALNTVGGNQPTVFEWSPPDPSWAASFHPVVLFAGDGLALTTQVACPATQTWVFDWTIFWHEF